MNSKWIIAVALIVVIGAAAGFVGYRAGSQVGLTQATAARAGFGAGRGQGGAGGGQGQGATAQGRTPQFNSANVVTGQVAQVNGSTIQLTTANGSVTIKTDSQTQVQKPGSASVSDIQPGERITIQGTQGADGALTAQAIQIGGGRPGGPNGQGTPVAGSTNN